VYEKKKEVPPKTAIVMGNNAIINWTLEYDYIFIFQPTHLENPNEDSNVGKEHHGMLGSR
jgi:hypothetical protein